MPILLLRSCTPENELQCQYLHCNMVSKILWSLQSFISVAYLTIVSLCIYVLLCGSWGGGNTKFDKRDLIQVYYLEMEVAGSRFSQILSKNMRHFTATIGWFIITSNKLFIFEPLLQVKSYFNLITCQQLINVDKIHQNV